MFAYVGFFIPEMK